MAPARRADPPGGGPRALVGVPRVVHLPRGADARGRPRAVTAGGPRRWSILSGDVHHAYLAEGDVRRRRGDTRRSGRPSARRCATRSPSASAARSARACRASSRAIAKGLARAAGVKPTRLGWKIVSAAPVLRQPGRARSTSTAARRGCGSTRPPSTGCTRPTRIRSRPPPFDNGSDSGIVHSAVMDEGGKIANAARAEREHELLRRYHVTATAARRTSWPRRCCRWPARSPAATPAAASRWTTSSRSPASGS